MTRPGARPVKHAEVAARLRAEPGVWMPVGEYRTWHSAWRTATEIQQAYNKPMYEPAGAFQTRTAPTEMGALVEARYVGQQPASDEAWADALAAITTGGEA
jgi:hypothetical protein